MVLTTIQQDLVDYNATDKSSYDDYTFYMWFSDSCQNSDITTCKNNVDQSALMGQNLSGKIEVELYTEGKKALTRKPETTLTNSVCVDKYLVNLNLDGGSSSTNSLYVLKGSTYGSVATLPTPTKSATVSFLTNGGGAIADTTIHYTFDGWYLDKDFPEDSKVTNSTVVSIGTNHTLYAKWSGNHTITLPTVTRTGYSFDGWYSNPSFTNKVGNAGDSYDVNTNVTLSARWIPISYYISLNNQEATSVGSTGVSVIYGSTMPTIAKPAKTYTVSYNGNGGSVSPTSSTASYVFGGYYTGTNGSGVQYYNSNGVSVRNWDLTSNTILYAKWTPASVTLPIPSRLGYNFLGWFTAASGGTQVGFAGSSFIPVSDITLYAQWQATTWYVSSPSQFQNTFAEALAVANDGATITLKQPVTDSTGTVTVSKNVTIDLGGYQWTRIASLKFSDGYTATIKNGTLVTNLSSDSVPAIQNYGTLTISNLTVKTTRCYGIINGSTSSTVGTIVMDNLTITSYYSAITNYSNIQTSLSCGGITVSLSSICISGAGSISTTISISTYSLGSAIIDVGKGYIWIPSQYTGYVYARNAYVLYSSKGKISMNGGILYSPNGRFSGGGSVNIGGGVNQVTGSPPS